MKLRNLLATAGATVIAATALAPVASAQNLGLNIGDEAIANFDCDLLRSGLEAADLVDENTTRTELAERLGGFDLQVDLDPLLELVLQTQYANRIADRALECGIVEEDPASLFDTSSDFLEGLGLPGVPELQSLSSF